MDTTCEHDNLNIEETWLDCGGESGGYVLMFSCIDCGKNDFNNDFIIENYIAIKRIRP